MAHIELPGEPQAEAPLPIQIISEDVEKHGSHESEGLAVEEQDPTGTTRKRRPWSSQDFRSILSPSPSFVESRSSSKDDININSGPVTPKRPAAASRYLSLQMPPRDLTSTSTANLSKRISVSPKPESSASYPSPASVLPRRSRGLDFSRAATNLHHSTLAESSPESSPVIGTRGGFFPRKGLFGPPSSLTMPDSPSHPASSLWSSLPNAERSGLSSSVGSSSMMEYESGSSTSDDGDAAMESENDDTIHMTPNINSTGSGFMNPFGGPLVASPGGDGVGEFTATPQKLMSYQRARVKSRGKRMSSSSASGHSSIYSPGPSSPPMLRSIESSLNMCQGYLLDEHTKREVNSRRESLSLGTTAMQLSDPEESDDGGDLRRVRSHEDVPIPAPVTPSMEDRRSVIRRAVTRRTNMLPKPKGFARIRAALLEEGAPIDTETRREAEVVRQVRENDAEGDLNLHPSQPTTTASSPNLVAVTAGPLDTLDSLEHLPEDESMNSEASTRRSSSAFASPALRSSSGRLAYWNKFDERMRTPPPQLIPREDSSGIGDDTGTGTPGSAVILNTPQLKTFNSYDSTSQTTMIDIPKKGNKRMRDDDFDPNYFKRRAVSPGLSLQNSPVLPQSPLQRETGSLNWGTPKSNRDIPSVHVSGERVVSNGSNGSMGAPGGTPKRVGLQGMTDTYDGLMNMSIE